MQRYELFFINELHDFSRAGTEIDISFGKRADNLNSLRKDKTMKKFLKRLEDIYSAVAFAEAGEFDTARKIMKEDQIQKRDRKTQEKRKRPRRQLRAPGIKR